MRYNVLKKPLTKTAIKAQLAGTGKRYHGEPGEPWPGIDGVVAIGLSEVVDRDFEQFLDLLSERLTGTELLENIDYDVVGHDGNELHILVSGDPAGVLSI